MQFLSVNSAHLSRVIAFLQMGLATGLTPPEKLSDNRFPAWSGSPSFIVCARRLKSKGGAWQQGWEQQRDKFHDLAG